jgi:3-methylfumaryl-CoA hydratase
MGRGPLIATLLIQLAGDETGRPPARFAFQAKRPLFDTAPFEILGRMEADGESCALWAADPEGKVAMTASVGFAG